MLVVRLPSAPTDEYSVSEEVLSCRWPVLVVLVPRNVRLERFAIGIFPWKSWSLS